jgi:hypothetical protein
MSPASRQKLLSPPLEGLAALERCLPFRKAPGDQRARRSRAAGRTSLPPPLTAPIPSYVFPVSLLLTVTVCAAWASEASKTMRPTERPEKSVISWCRMPRATSAGYAQRAPDGGLDVTELENVAEDRRR